MAHSVAAWATSCNTNAPVLLYMGRFLWASLYPLIKFLIYINFFFIIIIFFKDGWIRLCRVFDNLIVEREDLKLDIVIGNIIK